MLRGFTFEIYPSLEQKEMFWKTAGCNRLVWNLCLDYCKNVYEKSGKTPSAFNLCSFITSLKQTKKCSKCGFINKEVVLGIEKWICPSCGCRHDRDKNASKNIYKLGYKQLYRAGV